MTPPDVNLQRWHEIGEVISGALTAVGKAWQEASQELSPLVGQAFQNLGEAWDNFKRNLDPKTKQDLKDLFGFLVAVPWVLLIYGINGLAIALNVLTQVLPFFDRLIGKSFELLGTGAHQAIQQLIDWKNDISRILGDIGLLFGWHTADWIAQMAVNFANAVPIFQWMFHAIKAVLTGQALPPLPYTGKTNTEIPGNKRDPETSGNHASPGPLLPGHTLTPAQAAATYTYININGASTLDVVAVIDNVMAKAGYKTAQITRANGGFGVHTFGTFGASF
jgi:hypothetical protein